MAQLIICENLKSYVGRSNDSEAKMPQLPDTYLYEVCIPSQTAVYSLPIAGRMKLYDL